MPSLNLTYSPGALSLLSCRLVIAVALFSVAACDVLVSVDTRVERARSHLEQGQYRPAMTELKTALERQPDHVQARLLLAELSMWLGDLEGAQKELDRALSAGATDEQLRELRYELLFGQRRFKDLSTLLEADSSTPAIRRLVWQARVQAGRGEQSQAEAKLKLVLEQTPDDPEALLELARLAAARGEAQQALDLPQRIAQSDKVHARALMLRGSVLMGRGEHQQARDAFARAHELSARRLPVPERLAVAIALTEASLALNDIEAAGESLATIASWAPDSVITHYLRARIAMLKNDPIAAVADCQRALRIDPGHVQSQILLAAAHLSQGSVEQAEDVLSRLLASNPNHSAGRKLLAQVYLGRNQPERAQRLLSAAAGEGADPEIDWLMGTALIKAGSSAIGLEHLERSAAAAPQNMRRRIDLAGAYIAARAPEKAVEILSSIPAGSAFAARAKVLLVLATASGKAPAEAHREIKNLIARHDGDAALMTIAGAYLASTGDPGSGRALLERSVQLNPKLVDGHMALARLEAGARNTGAAERQLAEVLKIDPRHEMARMALAELAWGAGDRNRSRTWLEEAISVDPSAIEPRLRLAQIAFVEGDPARARGLLDQAVSVSKDRSSLLSAAGKVLAQAGYTDEAFAKFHEAGAAGRSEAVLDAARLHLDLDQRGQARELIEAALLKRPDWREAQGILVTIDAKDGQVARAISRAGALASSASPAATRVLEGDLYALAGQSQAAIEAYEEAQRQQPSAPLAIKIFTARSLAGAVPVERSLTQWLERFPADAEVRRVLAAHYESSGQGAQAVSQYERLLAADRIDPAMLNNLAWSLHENGDPRALELARRAHAAAPHIAEIGDTYGWILVQMDKVAEGLGVLEKALAGAPANPDIQYHAAVAYAKSGQTARATQLLRQSLKSDQKFAARDAAERLLQSMPAAGI